MKKLLVLKGCAGLGNRLITLYSAINYCHKTHRTIYVDWSDGMFADKGVNAFYKYFDLHGIAFSESIDEVLSALNKGASIYPKTYDKNDLMSGVYDRWHIEGGIFAQHIPQYRVLINKLFRGKCGILWNVQHWKRNNQKKSTSMIGNYFKSIKDVFNERAFLLGSQLPYYNDRGIVVFVDFRPYINLSYLFDNISLKEVYYQKFMAFAKQRNLLRHGIGVHIRATDKQPKKKLKKLQVYIDKLLESDGRLRLFLSTDNSQLTKEMEKRYNGRIVLYPKFLPEDLKGKGIHHWALEHDIPNIKEQMFEESLADMWILSMCKMLFWQGNSSFSMISSVLKKDKENVVNWLKL